MSTLIAGQALAIAAVLGVLALALRALAIGYQDNRNIGQLCQRYGCSTPEGTRLYRRSREVGFGAAYREVFGSSRIAPNQPLATRRAHRATPEPTAPSPSARPGSDPWR